MLSDWLATNYQVSFQCGYQILFSNKRLGQWEFVKKGEAPVVGITKLDGITLEDLKRPRRQIAPPELLQASSPTSVTESGSTSAASQSP